MLAIENVQPERHTNFNALLFLLKGEYFDLLLLYFNYLLKKMGIRVWYLGTNIRHDDLISIVCAKAPDFLLTYIRPREVANSGKLFNRVVEKIPASPLYVAGPGKKKNGSGNNIRYMHYNEMPMCLDEMCAR